MSATQLIDQEKVQQAANVVRAANHDLRQQLLKFITQHEPVMVSKIYHTLGIEQSVCSQHLKILRDAGFVKTERDGKKILYSVNYDRLSQFEDIIAQF